ncbi:cell division protein FtsK [Saccharopolyspora phatthalungensis]|uniref:S-DNA-T family DNA segregation ATPase FtsK/SpoIIIE n=1 Tax=Saccharopolyspora phatthalungensis TaxID=664693 RepID=A0A840PUR5_9PSEU|nr:cell division protein FtsK [Saccharopolyspora phatthalungensis]MBB5154032.1 S-DNA-T family DNA segregation ATPase FtsK/SpoIIIE [Saccharopolyspora phatthalungensis]
MGKETRRKGIEWRVAGWMVRHPGISAAPAVLGAGVAELGPAGAGATLAALGVAGLSWYRGHPETFDRYAAPYVRAFRRRWLRYVGRRWRDLMIDCEFGRENRRTGHIEVPRLLRVRSASPSIDTLYVKVLRGQSLKRFQDAQDELAMALRADALGIVKVQPGVIALTVVRGNPFADVIDPAEVPVDSADVDLRNLYFGEDEYGNDWTEPLLGHHLIGCGATGSGKDSLIWNPLRGMGPAIRDGLVRVDFLDLKGGMAAGTARSLFHRYAAEPDTGLEVIEAFRDDMKATQRHLAERGLRKFTVSRETPFRVLMIDELAMMTALGSSSTTRAAIKLMAEVMTQGRAPGFALCAYVQEPTKDIVPVRDLFTRRICLRTTAENHPDMVLGEGMRIKGALTDEIPADEEYAGIGFRVDQRSRRPTRVRAGWVSDADIAELVRTCTPGPVDESNVVQFHRDEDQDEDEVA